MRLTTWNCRVGAFRKKAAQTAPLTPDVLVVPECEDIRRELLLDGTTQPTTRLWFSSPATNRGVGVFSYSGATISPAPLIGEPIDFFVPLLAQVVGRDLWVVAVWTAKTKSSATSYRQAHEGLDRYAEWIAAKETVVMGDFNHNACFGNGKSWAELTKRLEPLGLVSAYHQFFGESFGAETRPTHFFRGKDASPFHLDYVFVPAAWTSRVESVDVGTYESWSKHSDHVPVTVDIAL
jgi:exodeoxyribonuclease-3